ncbi:hypothetical protein ACFYUD_31505 [Nocardia tengchongensis]|uniref:hypothetical protein n=1 Tax=Nocardia tengchongensis TaxID=2055889 RepID=UPI0036877D4A
MEVVVVMAGTAGVVAGAVMVGEPVGVGATAGGAEGAVAHTATAMVVAARASTDSVLADMSVRPRC